MRDFKNSLTDMDNKMSNPMISPYDPNDPKLLELQNRMGITNSTHNNLKSYRDTGESGTYNSVS